MITVKTPNISKMINDNWTPIYKKQKDHTDN